MDRRTAIKRTSQILGATISAGTLAGLMAGCKADIKLHWEPVIFTDDEVNTLIALTNTILPITETPSASEVGVPQYIDDIVANFWKPEDRDEFTSNLSRVNDLSRDRFDHSYIDLSEKEKNQIMDLLVEEAINPPDIVRPFFLQLKELTYSGYFSSKIIGEQVLGYDPVPGSYIGDLPVNEAEKAWSL